MLEKFVNKEHIRPFGWGATIGVVGTLIVLSWTDWMVTESVAMDAARDSANVAMIDSLAPICVTQFKADPASSKLLADLKALDSWKQYKFVQDQKWSTMPGAADPSDSDVAKECARLILAMVP
ncbi:MAG: hypothetical protein H8E94_09585 [Alphaproteobacteria bacterium]|nr:hypothetical protein [Alphaproteobacteria bacterium]